MSADQERVKTLLTETIILLCKNGLHFNNEFTVEGLIGITIDKNDVFLINIKETIQTNNNNVIHSSSDSFHLQRQTRKRRYNSRCSSNPQNFESNLSDHELNNQTTSCDDLSSSKCFSNSSDSPLNISVHSINAHMNPPGLKHDYNPYRDEVVNNPEVLSLSIHRGNYLRKDNLNNLRSPDMKNMSSTNQNTFENNNAMMHANEDPKTGSKNVTSPHSKCDSNFIPLKIKEEAEETDQVQVMTSPNISTNQKSFLIQDNQSDYSGINYSLVENSIAAYPALNHQSFQFYHNPQQNDQQVELLPGTGVFISKRAYIHLNKETWVRGSKLVRRVVREVFPDEHILARSSCLGRRLGGCHVGLDHHKVDTIKAFVQQRMPQVSHTEIVAAINECCRDIRAKLRKSYFRSANKAIVKPV